MNEEEWAARAEIMDRRMTPPTVCPLEPRVRELELKFANWSGRISVLMGLLSFLQAVGVALTVWGLTRPPGH